MATMTPIRTAIYFAFKKLIPFWLIAIPRIALNGLIIGAATFFFATACVYGYFFAGFAQKTTVSLSTILHAPSIVQILSVITAAAVSLFIWAAIKKIALDLYDHQKTPFFLSSQLGNGILIFCSTLIIHCIALIGYCMLIFPGTYMQQRWIVSSFFIVDKNKGPVAALSQSWRTTERIKRIIFWIAICVALITLSMLIFHWYSGSFALVKKLIAHQRYFFAHSYKYTTKINKLVAGFYAQHQANLLSSLSVFILFCASFWQLFLASLYRQLSEKK